MKDAALGVVLIYIGVLGSFLTNAAIMRPTSCAAMRALCVLERTAVRLWYVNRLSVSVAGLIVLQNAVETTPAPYAAQISSTAAMQRTSGETGAPTASETQSETFSATDSAATTTESSGAGGVMDMAGSVIVVMLGAFGVVWL